MNENFKIKHLNQRVSGNRQFVVAEINQSKRSGKNILTQFNVNSYEKLRNGQWELVHNANGFVLLFLCKDYVGYK